MFQVLKDKIDKIINKMQDIQVTPIPTNQPKYPLPLTNFYFYGHIIPTKQGKYKT